MLGRKKRRFFFLLLGCGLGELGLKVLRYGLPIHKIFRGPGRYDWE